MAVNLTLIAAEAFNEIVLHRLQNENLASAEKIERQFYQAFENLQNSPDEELFFENDMQTDINKAIVAKEFIFIYQAKGDDTNVLNICHISRNP